MIAIFISLLSAVSTFLGGVFAIKNQDRLHLILGFSAGALMGVAFFDLLPEAANLVQGTYSISTLTSLIALGFVTFMILDRLSSIHHRDTSKEANNFKGSIGAASLSLHSFLDGVGIGLAFKVSPAVGLIVATAVLVHDFSDGINTVSMILRTHGSKKSAYRWLDIDAIAPAFGAISTLFFTPKESTTGLLLALFCGFFFYIGACDLLPESYHRHPKALTTGMTIIGMAVLYVAIHLASL